MSATPTAVIPMRAALMSLVAICLMTMSLGLPFSMAGPQDGSAFLEESRADGLGMTAHKMTMSEMQAFRAVLGVRNPLTDYNVIVDGFGTGLAPPTEDGWLSMVGTANVLDSIEYDLEALPSSFDLSTLPTFPIVGNQRSQPSCAAWAATYYAYGFQEAVDQQWNQASEGAAEQLISPAWTYNKANGGRDLGSFMDENMMVIVDWGAATMATMPFDEYDYLDWGSPAAFREAPAHRAAEMFTIDYAGQSTLDLIKTLVTEGIPVTFGIDASEYNNAFADSNFIISSTEYSSYALNHAQTVVGFDDSVTDDGEVGAFRVVNSWGTSWGDSGFYWFTYDAMKELGDNDLAVLNYVTDISDYSPSIVATWHFNTGPSRGADLEVGLGIPSAPVLSKVPFVVDDRVSSHEYPEYMCLDVTEFAGEYGSATDEFYITIGASPSRGYVSSFKIELHEDGYAPGAPTHSSGQSSDVPSMNPCTVTNSLQYYSFISSDEALDVPGLEVSYGGETTWVAVDHHSHDGADSMQSGDAADGEQSILQVEVDGPVDVTFFWKVSSQSGEDLLSFSVPDSGILESVSGDVDWEQLSFALGSGTHTLVWTYSKDSSMSSLQDTAWIDSLTVSAPMPSFSLEPSYGASYGTPLLVTPLDVHNPVGGDMYFWYVWGDGGEGAGDPGADHSAYHTYLDVGDFDLVVYMEDSAADNISRSATVSVADSNDTPEITSMAVEPICQYHEPGEVLWLNISVSDTEGDGMTLTVDLGDGSAYYFPGLHSDPGEPVTVSIEHAYDLGDETPYTVQATVVDYAEHYSPQWQTESIDILVNTPPVASFSVDPSTAETGVLFSFDASSTSDAETSSASIEVRWDWDGDGTWDTSWSADKSASHSYLAPGTYEVVLEARDANGLTSSTSFGLEVTGEPIPEFPFLLLPVMALIAVFLVVRRRMMSGEGTGRRPR